MASTSIYQLKVTLKDTKPPIWRRLLVSSNTLLPDLHSIIQASMGWTNSHLHQFTDGFDFFGPPSEWDGMDTIDYRKISLDKMLWAPKQKITYEYDFGDDWRHQVLLEKVVEKEPDRFYPVCIKGKNACPPEDCGGVWGYAELLEILADPKHEDHEEMKDWIGGELDPKAFDLEEVNKRLQMPNYGVVSMF